MIHNPSTKAHEFFLLFFDCRKRERVWEGMTESASLRQLLGSDSMDSRVGVDAMATEEDSQVLQETSFVEDVSEDPFAGAFAPLC